MPICTPVGAVALGDGRFLMQADGQVVRLGRAGVETRAPLEWALPGGPVAIGLLGRTAFLARGHEAFRIPDAWSADPLVPEPWTTFPDPLPGAVDVPTGATSACIGDVCVVPALGRVSRRDGAPIGGPQLDARVAADGHDFYLAAGEALERLAPDGTSTAVGEGRCTHVAWTGTALIAECRIAPLWWPDEVVRLEGDRLVNAGNVPFAAPFASAGIAMVALIGTGAGALAVGVRESPTEDATIWAAPLDAQGVVAGETRLVARTPLAGEVRAVGSGDRVLVAWSGFGDPFPRVVTHVAVLDAAGETVAPPHAPLPRSAPGLIASDGAGWLLLWSPPGSDGDVRAVRLDRDGLLVSDVASEGGIDLGNFPLDSAIGLESGPYLLFGAGRQRTLRFEPSAD